MLRHPRAIRASQISDLLALDKQGAHAKCDHCFGHENMTPNAIRAIPTG